MQETERALLNDPITVYTHNEDFPESVILDEPNLLKELAGIWRSHETAMRTLIQVINAKVVKRMVEDCLPVEVAGLRHELDGANKVVQALYRYHEISERRDKKEIGDGKTVEPIEPKPAEEAESSL